MSPKPFNESSRSLSNLNKYKKMKSYLSLQQQIKPHANNPTTKITTTAGTALHMAETNIINQISNYCKVQL